MQLSNEFNLVFLHPSIIAAPRYNFKEQKKTQYLVRQKQLVKICTPPLRPTLGEGQGHGMGEGYQQDGDRQHR